MDQRTLSIIFLGEGTVFNRNFYVGAETDEVFAAWTRAPQIVRPNCAVQQAMELLWDRGYQGTTFDDLVGAMKLSPSSFYHEFGSKELLIRVATIEMSD